MENCTLFYLVAPKMAAVARGISNGRTSVSIGVWDMRGVYPGGYGEETRRMLGR